MRKWQDVLKLMYMHMGVSRWESCQLDSSFKMGEDSSGSDVM